jgi:exonuclease SbcD
MKLLHTSDWHLGHTIYGYDRTDEHRQMLCQMEDIIRTEQPDVFLLAGDVYHTAQPSAAVQTAFADAVSRFHAACPDMTIVLTAGNHDSGAKHDIFRTPWKALNVHTIGTLSKDSIEEHIIRIPDKGFVIAVPYTHERNLPEHFFSSLLALTEEQNTLGQPVILTAHTTVRGCDITGHDNRDEYSVGGIDYMDIDEFGTGYDYLALGHIHHAQFVHTGKHNVRYSGSPLPVSFDETYPHSVSIVEIDRHGSEPKVRTIDISNPRPLVSLPSHDFASFDEAISLLRDFPADNEAYIRLQVLTDTPLPSDANAIAAAALNGKHSRFCLINAKKKMATGVQADTLSIHDFQTRQPAEIAEHFAKYSGFDFDEEMQQLFRQAQQQAQNDIREGQ